MVDMADDVLNAYLSTPQTQEHALELRDTYWALGELTPDHRDAILLAGEGYTMEQAAKQMDISIGAFKTRLMRARIRLRCLNDDPATPKLSPRDDRVFGRSSSGERARAHSTKVDSPLRVRASTTIYTGADTLSAMRAIPPQASS